ncbi:MAG: PaaX family transcriptional regulator [Deltaproteobacteria bacterium]|nr:PaaX family transcriptional regulator [Deltaproteobacteria bacterium]
MYQKSATPVTAKSLVIDLLSTMPSHHPVPVGALVRAAALFGIGENSMRVALARLRSRGTVESDRRGLYCLSRAALPINRQVRSWSSIESGVGSWDGSYLAVETSGLPRRDKTGSRTRERALRFLGFESLTSALRVRPNNLLGGVDHCRHRLTELGFSPAPVVFRLSEFDAILERRARTLWDGYELETNYGATRTRLAESAQRLPQLSTEAAMAESFQLGGEAVRQIVLDPLLPKEIVDVETRGAMIDEMRRYDRIGREAWKRWAGASVEPESSPIDIGAFEPKRRNTPTPELA